MNANKYYLLILSGIFSFSTPSFAAERKEKEPNLLATLPQDILAQIILLLPNREDFTSNDIFSALDNLRLTNNAMRKNIDTYITNFISKHNIIVPPTMTPYQAFKKYISNTQTVHQIVAQRAKQEEQEIRESLKYLPLKSYGIRIPSNIVNQEPTDLLKEAIANLKENWLWQKITIEDELPELRKRLYEELLSITLTNEANYKTAFYMHFANAIIENKLLMVKALRPFIKPDETLIKYYFPELIKKLKELTNKESFNLLDISKASVNKLRQQSEQNPNDYLLKIKLKKAEEILDILNRPISHTHRIL